MVKVMTVDDSAFERKTLREMLEKEGFEVIEAESGEKGIETYIKEKPDIVLLDLRMPGISGGEVLQKLKEMDPDVSVIIVSIVRKKDEIDKLIKAGAKAYVIKPVISAKLIPPIKKILKEK